MYIFPGTQYNGTKEWWNTSPSARQAHTHTVLGYNVTSAQPHYDARSKSNILRSPHVAWLWPQSQWKLHITVIMSAPSLCPSVACQCICQFICLSVFRGVSLLLISFLVLVWQPGYEFTHVSAIPQSARLLDLPWSVCRSVTLHSYSVLLSFALLPVCLHVCCLLFPESSASAIKRNICSGSSRQQH